MKSGEVWTEIEDGTKVKIKKIKYSLDIKDYLVYYEGMERDWGSYLERKDFLNNYEFCRI